MTPAEDQSDVPEEDLSSAYSTPLQSQAGLQLALAKKTKYAPWHHPVKQIVRKRQWVDLTDNLVKSRTFSDNILRYFTLPGEDLLDIRVISDVCISSNIKIEYFGFNSARAASESSADAEVRSPWAAAEAALLQGGRITANSEIKSDRLEDIAIDQSNARSSLSSKPIFDVINIDACDYLAHKPANREKSTFDALRSLLEHQSRATLPWLLFVTTRAEPHMLGLPGASLQAALSQNISNSPDVFGSALASSMGWDLTKITSFVTAAWSTPGIGFMKIFSLGVFKYLLGYFHQHRSTRANVELKSVYTYKVGSDNLDMAALAFLITPDRAPVSSQRSGSVDSDSDLELTRACKAVRRLERIWDIDTALRDDRVVRDEAVSGTEALLQLAGYDLAGWRNWVATHPVRAVPMNAEISLSSPAMPSESL